MIVVPSVTAMEKPAGTQKEVPIKDKCLACSESAFIFNAELHSYHMMCKNGASSRRADCMSCTKPEHC